MPQLRRLSVPITEPGYRAISRAARNRGVTVADLVRRTIAAEIERPEVANVPPIGSPGKKSEKKSASKTQ